jgi:ubiquinone/menaquinone biosynthesis C-methylase UbiE
MTSKPVPGTTTLSEVHEYWTRKSCGSGVSSARKYSREYFEEIEQYRYEIEPEIFSFAQFTRYRGQKVLEVGVGAGTDFVQWTRAGAVAHGVDLTEEAIEHVRRRLDCYGLEAVVQVADAERLPFPDESFDLVYSWGVIHHSPDMERAFGELARCARRGGTIKVMIYHRHSLHVLYWWFRYALLRGRPFRTFADVMFHHQESLGTRAFTRAEIRELAGRHRVAIVRIDVSASPFYDLLGGRSIVLQVAAHVLACLLGSNRCGWYMRVEMRKP